MSSLNPHKIQDETIIKALCYADIFDFPLTLDEIVRFAPEGRITTDEALESLKNSQALARVVCKNGRYYYLTGKAESCGLRKGREDGSRRQLELALKRLTPLQGVPFLRMAAITGALAALNSPEGDDIDLLIINAPGRAWTTYFCMRLWRRFGKNPDVCFNMFLTKGDLSLNNENLFYARELLGALPIFNASAYEQLLDANEWVFDFFPSYKPDAERLGYRIHDSPALVRRRRLAEKLLGGRLGNAFEFVARKVQSKSFINSAPNAAEGLQRNRIKLHRRDNLPPILNKYNDRIKIWLSRYREAGG